MTVYPAHGASLHAMAPNEEQQDGDVYQPVELACMQWCQRGASSRSRVLARGASRTVTVHPARELLHTGTLPKGCEAEAAGVQCPGVGGLIDSRATYRRGHGVRVDSPGSRGIGRPSHHGAKERPTESATAEVGDYVVPQGVAVLGRGLSCWPSSRDGTDGSRNLVVNPAARYLTTALVNTHAPRYGTGTGLTYRKSIIEY